jgi:hypothetical protein
LVEPGTRGPGPLNLRRRQQQFRSAAAGDGDVEEQEEASAEEGRVYDEEMDEMKGDVEGWRFALRRIVARGVREARPPTGLDSGW